MKKAISSSILLAIIVLSVLTSISFASSVTDTLIYDNSYLTYNSFDHGGNIEFIDYGKSSGGLVSKFTFYYWTEGYTTGTIWITFYRYTNTSYIGDPIKTFTITDAPITGGYIYPYEYVIPEEDQFELPGGYFGYSYEMSSANTFISTASGGSGNDDKFWLYDDWYEDFYLTSFENLWSGFSMQVYKGLPINEITCDIKGYKFGDKDGDGVWDDGELPLPGWEIYLDANNNDQYDEGVDPDAVVTDANGLYLFENVAFEDPNVPETFVIREVLKDGWTQTLPGEPDYEYTILAEPNNVYGPYNFGNTSQVIPTDIKLYGYIETVDGVAISDAKVETSMGSTSSGFDYTDEQGYYEITVAAPFTGSLDVTKTGWRQNTWSQLHTNRTTDFQQDFEMLYLYGGGDGSESDPFQIYTPEQLNFISRQGFWHLDKHFVLMNDIDLSGYTGTSYNIIGLSTTSPFEGTFNGNGFSISNFTYETSETITHASLFGVVDGPNAAITNLRVIMPQINTLNASIAAPIIAELQQGSIVNCHVIEGSVTAETYAGGLVGYTLPYNSPEELGGIVENCSSSCTVTATSPTLTYAGGLIGLHRGQARRSYATGDVYGYDNVGGLAGRISGAFGSSALNGSLENCYARGSANGSESSIGGLVGYNELAEASNCYSTGYSDSFVGGLCGYSIGEVFTSCFWDTTTSSRVYSNGGTGLTTEQMQWMASYTGWDFDNIWRICDGMNYPRLQWEPKPVGDFVCPEGVEIADLMILCAEWLEETMLADMAPDGGDGYVDLLDWTQIAKAWQTSEGQPGWDESCDIAPETPDKVIDALDLSVFADQWLYTGAHYADIAPEGAPDGRVDLLDYALFTEHWMEGID